MADDRLEFMKYLATEAGKIIMGFSGNELESIIKEDGSPVTIADLKVSELVQAEISKRLEAPPRDITTSAAA